MEFLPSIFIYLSSKDETGGKNFDRLSYVTSLLLCMGVNALPCAFFK